MDIIVKIQDSSFLKLKIDILNPKVIMTNKNRMLMYNNENAIRIIPSSTNLLKSMWNKIEEGKMVNASETIP